MPVGIGMPEGEPERSRAAITVIRHPPRRRQVHEAVEERGERRAPASYDQAATTRRIAAQGARQARRRRKRPLSRLPRPLKSSTAKSTTVSAYAGWPRNSTHFWISTTSTTMKPAPSAAK